MPPSPSRRRERGAHEGTVFSERSLPFFSPSDLNPTKNSGPVIIHASRCEKYGRSPGPGSRAVGSALRCWHSGPSPRGGVGGPGGASPASCPCCNASLERSSPWGVALSGSPLLPPSVDALATVGGWGGVSRSRWHEAGTRSRGLWRNSHGSVVCARPTVGVDLRWGCPLQGCVLTAFPHVSGKTLQWRPSTPTKQHTTPSCAGQVSAAAPFQGGGLELSLQ